MAASPKLSFVEKNSGMVIEELLLAGVDPQRARLSDILTLCMHYRRVGICRWLTLGDPELLFAQLANSAWVFAAWSSNHADPDKRTSKIDPLWDAVAAGATAAGKSIIAAARTTWNEGVEYEEDFCYARVIHHLVTNETSPIPDLLARWTKVSGGDEPRFAICRALHEQDDAGFTEAIGLLLDELLSAARTRQKGSTDQDAAVTTDRLSLEGIALIKIARQRGLTSAIDHRLVHAELLAPPTQPLPGPNDWKTIENHRDLT
jgi:Immunity protein 49